MMDKFQNQAEVANIRDSMRDTIKEIFAAIGNLEQEIEEVGEDVANNGGDDLVEASALKKVKDDVKGV